MGQSSTSPGGSTSAQTKSSMPAWETPYAKAYLSSLAGLVFPGMTVPSNMIGQKGYNFPNGGGSGSGAGGAGGTGGQATQFPGLDPQLASQFITPMLSSS